MSNGKVYLIGTGPGDAELITIKGCRLISQADVILYDQLIPYQYLKLAKPSAELISVGKFAGCHTLPQDRINALILEKAKEGKIVVRLKGGDPYLFGRGGEEAEACVNAGVEFEEVPGVTSAIAAPSYAGIPPTHRDYTSNVAIVTGHRRDEEQIEIPKAGTVIFLMGVSNIKKIISILLNDGWPKETKIAAVEHGTCYNQRVIAGTLGNFVETVQKADIKPPAVFIVGKVVELSEKLNWFARKPNVLVLGSHPEKYSYLGNIVHRPIIDCVKLEDYSNVDNIISQNVNSFDWVVFTSVNGARYFFQRLFAVGKDARSLSAAKIAVIGKTTAEKVKEFGLIADVIPGNESSAGLIEEFSKYDMTNKKVLLSQPQIASEELPNGLLNMKAQIVKLPVYKTIDIDFEPVDLDFINIILFTSGSTVRAFVKHFDKIPKHIKVYCLGFPTLSEAKKHNITAEVIPMKPC